MNAILLMKHSATCLYTKEWVIHVDSVSDAKAVAKRFGFQYHSRVNGQDDMHVLRRHDEINPSMPCHFHTNRLIRHHHVKWACQQEVKKRRRKEAPVFIPPTNTHWIDPEYDKMWYLTESRRQRGEVIDLNVQEAWALGFSGKGVVVSILDDGIEYTHPDLKANYDPLASTDLNGEDNDPMPDTRNLINKHGTRCAGEVAAAGNNTVCMVGVAYRANIGGVRMLDGDVTDRIEASALGLSQQHVHIYSGSWGPDDNGLSLEGPGVLAAISLKNGITTGRGGLGNIYVWASGNGGEHDSCAADGYASSMFTISVSSVTEKNTRPWYLEGCSSTLISTYSSGSKQDRYISTVDLFGKCTNQHSGTSASAPLVAGSVALMLEANPYLNWRDVQYISVLTANSKPFKDGNFQKNGAGHLYSFFYGFGMADAGKMVRLAQMWRGLSAHHKCDTGKIPQNISLRDQFELDIPLERTSCREHIQSVDRVEYIEHVELYLGVNYSVRGDLQISLTSPSGTTSILLPYRSNDHVSGNAQFDKWPLMSVQFWGEDQVVGQWTVRITNAGSPSAGKDGLPHEGYVSWVQLILYGTDDKPIKLRPAPPSPSPDLMPDPNWMSLWSPYVVTDVELQREKCHSSCATCQTNSKSADDCLKCHSNWLYMPVFHRCVPNSCPQRFYRDGDNCYRCGTNCVKCASSNRCSMCEIGYNLAGDATCVSTCPTGTYADSTRKCQTCHPTCHTCDYSNSPLHCTSCGNGDRHFLPSTLINEISAHSVKSQTLGQCVRYCPLTLYYNVSVNQCAWCPPNCANCSQSTNRKFSTTCHSCDSPFYLSPTGSCLDPADLICPIGTYRTLPSNECRPCHSSCKDCYGGSSDQCITCKPGRVFLNHTCLDACPQSHYVSNEFKTRGKGDTMSNQCRPCYPTCETCTGPLSHQCQTCGADYIRNEETNKCEPIVTDALFTCTQKNQYLLRTALSSKCVDQCPSDGYFSNPVTRQCLPCPLTCRSCSEGSGHCTSCYLGWTLDSLGYCQRGVHCHADKYFDISSQKCDSCPTGCSRCSSNKMESCKKCARMWCRLASAPSPCYPCCDSSSDKNENCQPCVLGSEICSTWKPLKEHKFVTRATYIALLCAFVILVVVPCITLVSIWYRQCCKEKVDVKVHYRRLSNNEEEGRLFIDNGTSHVPNSSSRLNSSRELASLSNSVNHSPMFKQSSSAMLSSPVKGVYSDEQEEDLAITPTSKLLMLHS